MDDYDVTLNYDDNRLIGRVHLTEFAEKLYQNLNSYVLVPVFGPDAEGKPAFIGFSMVHVSMVDFEKLRKFDDTKEV